jgi:hypothetical protein
MDQVRWLAPIGAGYGVIAVAADPGGGSKGSGSATISATCQPPPDRASPFVAHILHRGHVPDGASAQFPTTCTGVRWFQVGDVMT